MRKVAIVGVGHTKFMFNSPKSEVEMLAEASMDAIQTSHLKPQDIQAIFCGNVLGDFSEGRGMIQSHLADDMECFNVPASRFEGACASATIAIRDVYIQKKITEDQVLNGFMVTTPLQLLDCCPSSDGAAFCVIASEEVAKKLIDKPVYIAGVGQVSSDKLSAQYSYCHG